MSLFDELQANAGLFPLDDEQEDNLELDDSMVETTEEEETVTEEEEQYEEGSADEEGEEELSEEDQAKDQFIRGLHDVGIEITDEEYVLHEGDLAKIMEAKKQQIAGDMLDRHLGTLEPRSREVALNLLKGMSLDEVLELKAGNSYSEEDIIADPEVQKNIIIQNEKRKGRTDRQIEVYLKGLGEDLSEEAIEANKELELDKEAKVKNKEKDLEESRKAQKKRADEITSKAVSYIDTASEFIPGLKLTSAVKESAKKQMFDVYKDVVAKPEEYVGVLALLKHYGILDGKFDAVQKVKTTSAANLITKAIKEKNGKDAAKIKKDVNTNYILANAKKYFNQ